MNAFVLDSMVKALRDAHADLMRAIDVVDQLPVRRRGELARKYLRLDLECRAGKIRDTLAVYGMGDLGRP